MFCCIVYLLVWINTQTCSEMISSPNKHINLYLYLILYWSLISFSDIILFFLTDYCTWVATLWWTDRTVSDYVKLFNTSVVGKTGLIWFGWERLNVHIQSKLLWGNTAPNYMIARSEFEAHRQIYNEGNVLFNDTLNTFYLRLYGVRHMVKDQSDSERVNPLLLYGLLFLISSKGSFICTIPQTG